MLDLLLVSALAAGEKDAFGMRAATTELTTTASIVELEQCIVRQVGRSGRATVIDIGDGKAVDLTLGIQGTNAMTLEIHRVEDGSRLNIKYRHPFSDGVAVRFLKKAAQRCFPENGGPK